MDLAFLFLVAVALVESALSAFFVTPYFRFGIPLFRASRESSSDRLPDLETIENIASATSLSRLSFRNLGQGEVGFRESLLGRSSAARYTPIMRGRLIAKDGRFEVVGYANWSVFVFFFFLVHKITSSMPGNTTVLAVFLSITVAIVIGIYLLQRKIFTALLVEITTGCSK